MKQKVVIIGVSFSSRLALARSIGALDCDITVIAWSSSQKESKPIDGYSKYVSRVLFCRKEEAPFIKLLKEQCVDPKQKVVLVPDCDFSVSIIDLHLDELSPFFLFPTINHQQGSIVEWSDKLRQKELASRIGMEVAKSTVIEIKDGQFDIPDTISYPCFPKPLASVAGGKAGMRRCENKHDLENSLLEIIRKKTSNTMVLVEDYMEIEKEYAVLGFSDGKEVCIPGVIQFIVGSKTQKGIALQGRIMPIDGFARTIEQFKEYVRSVGLVGLFDIDFYESRGRLFFSELNLRYGGSGYAVVKMGVNLPAMFVSYLMGQNVDGFDKVLEDDAIFTNERMCYNDLLYGHIDWRQYQHYIKTADILFIKDDEDYEPYHSFQKMVVFAAMKSYIKSLLRWK